MLIDINAIKDLEDVACRACDVAREAILPLFRSDELLDENKLQEGYDPVTQADRNAEAAMRRVLENLRPMDTILGEEFETKEGTSGLTWVLDPIDGTRGFVSGTPTWGVLVALGDVDGPFLGVIDQPYIGERFIGHAHSARVVGPHGMSRLATRAPRDLSEATIFTTFPEVGDELEGRAFHAVASKCRLTRYGMDCYAYALLAAGQIDLVIEAGLQSYDIQAPIAVVEASGGVVTDWQGNPAHNGGRAIAAANAEIHAQALEILQASIC